MKQGESSLSDASMVLFCNRSYQGEPAGMKAATGTLTALSGGVEMGVFRSKEWACNVSRIATTAGLGLNSPVLTPPWIKRSNPPPPNSSKKQWDQPCTSAVGMILSCWVPT